MNTEHRDSEGGPRKIFGRASVVAAGTAYQQGVSFISGLIVARVLGAADYGIFNLARNMLDVTAIMTRLGLDIGLQRRFGEARSEDSEQAALIALRRLRLLSSMAAMVPVAAVALGVGTLLEQHVYNYPGFGDVLLVLALALPFVTDISVLGGAYRGRLRLAPSVLAESVLLPTIRLLTIVLLFLAGWRLWAVVAGTTFASLLAAAALALRARRDFAATDNAQDYPWRDTFRVVAYSSVLAVGVLVATLTSTLDLLVLGRYGSAEDLGQYSLVKTLLLLMGVFGIAFAQGLGALVAERYNRGDIVGVVNVMSLTARWITLGTLPVYAVFLFWGSDLVLIFGESFAIDQSVIVWLATGQFLFSVLGPAGWALSMTGKQLLELKTLAVGLLTAVAACAFAIPVYGQLGAGMAYCLSIAVAQATRLVYVRRHLGRYPFSSDILVITSSGLLVALVCDQLANLLMLSPFWKTAAALGMFALAYLALAWFRLLHDFERNGVAGALGATRQFLFCRVG